MWPRRSKVKLRRNWQRYLRGVWRLVHRWNPYTKQRPCNDEPLRTPARRKDRRTLPRPASSAFPVLRHNQHRPATLRERPGVANIVSSFPPAPAASIRLTHSSRVANGPAPCVAQGGVCGAPRPFRKISAKHSAHNRRSSSTHRKKIPRSKSRRSIDPQQPRLRPPGVFPSMRRRAFEIEAVACFQTIMFLVAQPDLEFAAQDVQKFLSLVRVRFSAATVGLHTEQMRFHRRVSPSEQLHPHARRRLQDFSLRRAHQPRILSRGLEKRKNIRAVVSRNASQR